MSFRNAAFAGAIVVAGAAWFGWTREDPARLTFLAVGQGDCAVFQHGGRTVLVDAGPAMGFFDAGERIVRPRLRAMGVSRVDLILLTHPDLDHVGGVPSLLKAFPEARLAASYAFRGDPQMAERLREWKTPPEKVAWLPPEARLTVGDFQIRLYSPPPGADANDGSVFVRLTGRGASAVLTGDAPDEVEARVSRHGDWSAQVLKAGHHGSATSTSAAFLRAVRPTWLVVSCGRDNRYGHPAREVLQRANEARISVARTDRDGDIAFEVRNGRFEKANEGGSALAGGCNAGRPCR